VAVLPTFHDLGFGALGEWCSNCRLMISNNSNSSQILMSPFSIFYLPIYWETIHTGCPNMIFFTCCVTLNNVPFILKYIPGLDDRSLGSIPLGNHHVGWLCFLSLFSFSPLLLVALVKKLKHWDQVWCSMSVTPTFWEAKI
jgi:hypothetical protein